MRRIFRLTHGPDYYRGLGLLLLSCLPLVWALWRDAFTPQVFLAGLLCFSWGYAFLWRYDLTQALADLRTEMEELKRHLAQPEKEEPTLAEIPDTSVTSSETAVPLTETIPVSERTEVGLAEDGNGQ